MIIRNCKHIGQTEGGYDIYEVEVVTKFFFEKRRTTRIRKKDISLEYYWEETGEQLHVDERLAFYEAERILQFKEDKIKEPK